MKIFWILKYRKDTFHIKKINRKKTFIFLGEVTGLALQSVFGPLVGVHGMAALFTDT